MTRPTNSVLLALVLSAAVVVTSRPAAAQEPAPRAISVNGEGIVRVQPDQATVRFGVVTQHANPEEAQRLNTQAAARAMNAVRALGVPDRNIQLEVLRLQPERRYDEQSRRYEQVGYEAVRMVSVVLEDLDQLPRLIGEIVQQGANRLEQISYDLKNRSAARDRALREAVTNARDKARLMASALDVEVGPVQRIDEQGFSFPQPVMRAAMADMAMAKAAPESDPDAFSAGEIEVRASVHAVFSIR